MSPAALEDVSRSECKMRNLKLLKRLCSAELTHQRPGSPLCAAVRSDSDTVLLASQFSIVEFDPRSGQVGPTAGPTRGLKTLIGVCVCQIEI